LAVGQAHAYVGQPLPFTADEIDIVAKHLPPSTSFTSIANIDATVDGVANALGGSQWFHLACHGHPNREKPFDSSFALRDGALTIQKIIQSDLHNPQFAFLSACHTTAGDGSSPDEAIHLAAAMQFSGFRSVVGTMWSVHDAIPAKFVSTFYDMLVDDSGRLDCARAAVALHQALKKLRNSDEKIPLNQQIVFIHIGV